MSPTGEERPLDLPRLASVVAAHEEETFSGRNG
jgi:hypothetical protein